MKNLVKNSLLRMLVLTATLSIMTSFAFAAVGAPIDPALAAKKENVRKQQEQRITPAKRKAASQALKELRQKIHKARQEAPMPVANTNNK